MTILPMRATTALRSALVGLVLGAAGPAAVGADAFTSPDILVLGDSQISFGSGPVFVDFMSQLDTACAPTRTQSRMLKQLGEMKVGVIGVRSTSIHSWTARKGAAKGAICNVDKKWKVNAGTYGVVNTTGNEFKQMGQGRNYQFCSAGKSPFEAMFRDDYYAPKLLVLTFLGNAARRWADQPELALADVRNLEKQLPPDLPCVFMTTAPAHTKKVSRLRARAQDNISKAFRKTGGRCAFVEGITPETIATNQSTPSFFRRHKDGRVKDPYHPNERGARHHFKQRGPALCAAIFEVLARTPSNS
ncbi:MAG: SGNH/GDSL hydrolase family protein [Pseudomonadota bacterium]